MPLAPTEAMLREARESLPELPEARMRALPGRDGAGGRDRPASLAADPSLAAYFEEVCEKVNAEIDADPAKWSRKSSPTG